MTTRRTSDHQATADQDSPEQAGDLGLPNSGVPTGRPRKSASNPTRVNTAPTAAAADRSRSNDQGTGREADSGAWRNGSNEDRTTLHHSPSQSHAVSLKDDANTDTTHPTSGSTATLDTNGQTADDERAGVDSRRRGWFWHWNNVVTQYAPLIGLKGVGLLNSYTVWTDRRDESPHRGFAFPSQQSEADFYGEDRAELITINKILVALDLIEIRKQMLTRVDERGRRWRVPHNLYRVKDRPDGVDLRARDVMNVALLAKRDDAVFRYVRRVFSDRFKPIDADNVWHRILEELRTDPTWNELQERTRVIEARASARSRAGHQRRNGADKATATTDAPAPNDLAEPADSTAQAGSAHHRDALPTKQQDTGDPASQQTSVDDSNTGSVNGESTVVDPSNSGSGVDAATGNNALQRNRSTSVAGSSNGHQPVVGPSNTTYDQDHFTTTTTTRRSNDVAVDGDPDRLATPRHSIDEVADVISGTTETTDTTTEKGIERVHGQASGRLASGQRLDSMEGIDDERQPAGTRTGGSPRERRLADPAAAGPVVDPGPLVVSTFEAANDRRATPLERHLLAELERDADPAARAVGSTGADWVVAAMREAVASGSAFVAPKRVREIIARWSANPRNAPSSAPTLVASGSDGAGPPSPSGASIADVRLPGGASGTGIWDATLSDLARALDRTAFDRLLAGSRITRYWRGTVEITVAGTATGKLSNEYRGLIERQLNSRLRRPVAVRFVAADDLPADLDSDASESVNVEVPPQPLSIDEGQVEIGRQVWQSLQADLSRVITATDLDRLAGVVVLGQDAAGQILLGTPSPMARRLIDGRYRADIERSLAALFGQSLPIRTLDTADWTISNS